MRSRLGMRRRLILSLIGVVAATVLLVGAASVLLVDRYLRDRLVDEALAAAEFNLTVLTPATGIGPAPDAAEVEAAGLIDRFLRRGTDGAWVEFGDGNRLAGGLAPPEVSRELREIVARGDIGYQFVESTEGELLITGASLPPAGPAFFFTTSADPATDTGRRLLFVVSIVGVVAIVGGALVASRAARRMLRPVAAAQEAAEHLAGGDLGVRLAEEGADEFGRLSRSFNRMAASLHDTIAQLDEARARERRFVADVSHELRTPLTGLVNEAQMLLARLRSGERITAETRTIASMLETDVARLRHLVEDLLEISRLDSSGELDLPRETDVTALLGALIAERHPRAGLNSGLASPVLVDPRALERIVGNLLDNARIHAPGAEVIVTTALRDPDLVIEVADRGPGVPPEALGTIFERFSTADPARSGGTGLGLAIVAQHAARMGGEVTAALREGGGLVFTVRIPVEELLHDGEAGEMFVSHSGD
jgi:signal transduction histidine kinase